MKNMQNKIFIDTNILIDIIVSSLDENGKKIQNARVDFSLVWKTKSCIEDILLSDANCKFVLYGYSIATAFFRLTNNQKRLRISTLDFLLDDEFWEITNDSKKLRLEAIRLSKSKNADYEDMVQYLCAKNTNSSMIITNDKNFPQLDIPLKRTNPNLDDYLIRD